MESPNFSSSLHKTNLYESHKYQALNPDELGYFIEQVGLASQSVGLTLNEATSVTNNMNEGFAYRCKPVSALVAGGIPGPQSVCTDSSCPLAPNYDCSAYDFNNGTSTPPQEVHGPPSSSASPIQTSSPTITPSSDHNKTVGIAVGVAVPLGVIALALLGFLFFRRKMAALENRLGRIEGGDNTPPPMVSLGFPSNSRTTSQVQELAITPQHRASPDNRLMSWEYLKPVVQAQTSPVEIGNENTQAGIPFTRPPQEMA